MGQAKTEQLVVRVTTDERAQLEQLRERTAARTGADVPLAAIARAAMSRGAGDLLRELGPERGKRGK